MRLLTRISLIMFGAGVLAAATLWAVDAPPLGELQRAHGWQLLAQLVTLLLLLPSGLALVLMAPVEIYDRLRPGVQRRILAALSAYVGLGHIDEVAIHVHVSFVLFPLVAGFGWDAFATVLLTTLLIVVVHEGGHALVVRAVRGRVVAIRLSPIGGACLHRGVHGPIQQSLVAWGGVAAQMVLQALLWLVPLVLPASPSVLAWVADASFYNLLVVATNLLPVRPLDGYEAWQLPRLLLGKPARALQPRADRALPNVEDLTRAVVDEALERAREETVKARRVGPR